MVENGKRFIITNFAYGFGPFLRTTELALATSDEIFKNTGERLGVIVPWVYGEPQKRILLEEFGSVLESRPDAIVLDKRIGAQLELLFYGEKGYEESLRFFYKNHLRVTDAINHYIANGIVAETMFGEPISISKSAIAFCISRAPRAYFDIEPSYYTSFGYVSQIHEMSLDVAEIGSDRKLREETIPLLIDIEKKHRLHFISEPGTFNFLEKSNNRYVGEILTPPNALEPKTPQCLDIKKGIYVTITGIPGLERLFQEAHQLGFQFYSNKSKIVPDSIQALPHVLRCPQISLHFARAGWGSIWYSMFTGVPLVVPKYDSHDDPEIFFNNICVEKLGLGIVYNQQPLTELLTYSQHYKSCAKTELVRIKEKYGTTDGVNYTASRIADDFGKNFYTKQQPAKMLAT